MSTISNWDVGDVIIDYSQAYKITKITSKSNPVVHYRPYFTNYRNATITRSIPLENLEMTNKRKALDNKSIDKLLTKLAKSTKSSKRLNLKSARESLHKNDPDRIVEILRRLQREKLDENINFTITRKELYESATNKFAEEIAVVKQIKLDKAKKMIAECLENHDY